VKVNYLISNLNTSIEHEFDFEFEEANHLLKEWIKSSNTKNRLFVESSTCALDFYLENDESLWVEIYSSRNNLWAISEINLKIGEEMLKIAYAGKDFGEIMPATNKTWDVHTPLDN
jgi:hypothetical protein